MKIAVIGEIRKPVNGTKADPVPSQRSVISESEILSEECPKCRAPELTPCRNANRQPLAYALDSTEMRFHSGRIFIALQKQISTKMHGTQTNLDRWLIVYYAFNMLCDAVAANSEKMFGKEMRACDVEAFFAQQAITVLRADRLIDC